MSDNNQSTSRGNWSTRAGFILAATGSAIGLGNIWKFPFMAGVNGGAAFVFVYLLALIGFALPIVIAELLIEMGPASPLPVVKLTMAELFPSGPLEMPLNSMA